MHFGAGELWFGANCLPNGWEPGPTTLKGVEVTEPQIGGVFCHREVIFGLPGDGINGIIEALRRRQDRIRFVQVRHEEAAAFMACGYAKFTGKLGVCLATSGPGGVHLLNGLYDAKADGQPLAIPGCRSTI